MTVRQGTKAKFINCVHRQCIQLFARKAIYLRKATKMPPCILEILSRYHVHSNTWSYTKQICIMYKTKYGVKLVAVEAID